MSMRRRELLDGQDGPGAGGKSPDNGLKGLDFDATPSLHVGGGSGDDTTQPATAGAAPGAREVFEEVRAFLERFTAFEEAAECDLAALWVMRAHVGEDRDAPSRLWVTGEGAAVLVETMERMLFEWVALLVGDACAGSETGRATLIKIALLPPHPDEDLEIFRPGRLEGELASLRRRLSCFAKASADDVRSICENDLAPLPEGLAADEGAAWEPLFALAVLVERGGGVTGLTGRLSEVAEAQSGRRREQSLEGRVVRLLGEVVDTGEPEPLQGRWYGARCLFRALRETQELPELADLNQLTGLLARLGIKSERRFLPGPGRYERCYELDPGHIAELRDRFGIRFVPGAHGRAGGAAGREEAA